MGIRSQCGWNCSTTSISTKHSLSSKCLEAGNCPPLFMFWKCGDLSPLWDAFAKLLWGLKKKAPTSRRTPKWLDAPFRHSPDPLHTFLQPIQRRRVRNANETFGAKSGAIRDHGLLLLQKRVRKVARRLRLSFEASAHVRESVERALWARTAQTRDFVKS